MVESGTAVFGQQAGNSGRSFTNLDVGSIRVASTGSAVRPSTIGAAHSHCSGPAIALYQGTCQCAQAIRIRSLLEVATFGQ